MGTGSLLPAPPRHSRHSPMSLAAFDLMSPNVLSAAPAWTLDHLIAYLTRHMVSGVPVVDQHGALVGVISATDLARCSTRPVFDVVTTSGDGAIGRPTFHFSDNAHTRVDEVMTRDVVAVDEGAPVREIVRLMCDQHIHRVFVTKEGRLVGVVSVSDLFKALE